MVSSQISQEKQRLVAIVPKDMVEELKKIAYDNGRMSVSAYIVRMIDEEIKRKKSG